MQTQPCGFVHLITLKEGSSPARHGYIFLISLADYWSFSFAAVLQGFPRSNGINLMRCLIVLAYKEL